MSENHDPASAADPCQTVRDLRDANLDAWAKVMTQLVNTDAYAGATAELVNLWFTGTSPLRQMVENVTTESLRALHLASRDDCARLSDRLTHIEMRLDDIEAKLDQSLSALAGRG